MRTAFQGEASGATAWGGTPGAIAGHQPAAHPASHPVSAAPAVPAPLLQVQGVSLDYRTHERVVRATHQVSFDVHAGERYVLLGALAADARVEDIAHDVAVLSDNALDALTALQDFLK